MQITKDAVALIHYTLTDDEGTTIDSSAGGEPLAYIHGNGNLIPGLERELEGKGVEIVDVRVASEEELSHGHVHDGPGGHHHESAPSVCVTRKS